MTIKEQPACEPPRRVLAAIDGSPAARGAAAQAVALARACGAQLRFLHVADPRLLLEQLPLPESGSDALAHALAMGSGAEAVLRHCEVPVLVVRA